MYIMRCHFPSYHKKTIINILEDIHDRDQAIASYNPRFFLKKLNYSSFWIKL